MLVQHKDLKSVREMETMPGCDEQGFGRYVGGVNVFYVHDGRDWHHMIEEYRWFLHGELVKHRNGFDALTRDILTLVGGWENIKEIAKEIEKAEQQWVFVFLPAMIWVENGELVEILWSENKFVDERGISDDDALITHSIKNYNRFCKVVDAVEFLARRQDKAVSFILININEAGLWETTKMMFGKRKNVDEITSKIVGAFYRYYVLKEKSADGYLEKEHYRAKIMAAKTILQSLYTGEVPEYYLNEIKKMEERLGGKTYERKRKVHSM